MLENHTLKAILEALLFVSDKPVTLRHMTAKIRSVIRREKAAMLGDEAVMPTQDETNAKADVSEAMIEQTDDVLVESVVHETCEEFEAGKTVESVAVESSDAAPQADAQSDAVLDQLLTKQKELDDDVTTEQIKQLLFAIEEDLNRTDRGLELVQVARGYQLRTKYDISCYLKDDKKPAPSRLSPSSLETLAIVAYEQPVGRNRVEDIRGVDCGGVLKTLLDKDLVRIVGRSDEPGRPLVYGTTNKFLEVFGLPSLKDLPSPADFQELNFSEEANVEVVSEEDDGNEYVHARDFSDDDAQSLSASERAILDELDESLSGLKEVEKGIELFQKPKEEVPADALPVAENT